MELFREFLIKLMGVIDCEFKAIMILDWKTNKFKINYLISKEYVTAKDVIKIERVLHDYNMLSIGHIMFINDTTVERMNTRITMELEDNLQSKLFEKD